MPGTPAGPVLVLEGALAPPGAAVVVRGEVVAFREAVRGRGRRGDLFGAARTALAAADVEPGDLAGVVAGLGPGSMTGLRVALGMAAGLGLARESVPAAGVDAPRILAAAAGLPLPARVGIPWGRLRVLLAEATAGGPRAGAGDLVPVSALAGRRELVGREIAVPADAGELPWPAGTRPVPARVPPVVALARLVAEGAVTPGPGTRLAPLYLVPPDAVLPERRGRLPGGYRLVELGPADLHEVATLEKSVFRDPWTPGMIEAELAGGGDRVRPGVRDAEGRLVAWGFGRLGVDALEILVVGVVPGARGRGLGRAIVREMLRRARAAGLARADLEVRASNRPAILLYASEGFVPVGRRPRYYRDGEDALLMSLVLRR